MTPENVRHLLGGYATGTLTDQEKRLLFEAALVDQELFDQIAGDESLRELLEDSETRGYLLEALEEAGPERPLVELPLEGAQDFAKQEMFLKQAPAPAPARARAQVERTAEAPPPPSPPSSQWLRYGSIAATVVVLAGATIFGIRQFGSKDQEVVSVAKQDFPASPAQAEKAMEVSTPEQKARQALKKAPSAPLREGEADGSARSAGNSSKDKSPVVSEPADRVAVESRTEEPAADLARKKEQADQNKLQTPQKSGVPEAIPAVAAPPTPAPGGAPQQAEERQSAQSQPQSQSQSPFGQTANLGRISGGRGAAEQPPDGSRPRALDASELYQQQQSQVRTAFRLSDQAASTSSRRADDARDAERAKAAPSAARSQAQKPKPAPEYPGLRYQVRRRDTQGNWVVVPPSLQFQAGDQIALHIEQNVSGELRVFYQDAGVQAVPLALLDDPGGKRTAPFTLQPGTAQFTIVLRGPAAAAIPPTPSSQVVETEGPNVYVVRPNAPENSPVVGRISLTVR